MAGLLDPFTPAPPRPVQQVNVTRPPPSMLEMLLASIPKPKVNVGPGVDTSGLPILAPGTNQSVSGVMTPTDTSRGPMARAAGNPYANDPGLLSQLLGETNPFAQWADRNSNRLTGIGQYFLSGMEDTSGIMQGAALDKQQHMSAAEWDKAQANRKMAVQMIGSYGDGYEDIMQALEMGVLDGGQALREASERRSGLAEQARIDTNNRGNASFITDPGLKAAVESGAMTFSDAYKLDRGGDPAAIKTGYTPIWGTIDGRPAVALPGNDGKFYVDGKPIDPNRFIPTNPYDLNALKAGGTAWGKATGGAQFSVPQAEQELAQSVDAIGNLQAPEIQKGMADWFNAWGALPRGMWVHGGSNMAKFQNAANNIIDRSWLSARAMLKGAGQVTDYEGAKAENAVSMMKTSLEKGDRASYEAAVADYEYWIRQGFAKLQQQAGSMPSFGGQGGGLPVGTVEDGFRYIGGDPGNPANWEQVQ